MADERVCECEVLHLGPICDEFVDDEETELCAVCEHLEECHEWPE